MSIANPSACAPRMLGFTSFTPTYALSKVALVWMIDQATTAGVSMLAPDRNIAANPVLHDKSSNLYADDGPAPTNSSEDRRVRGLPGGSQWQRRSTIGGMSYADTVPYIKYDGSPKGIVSGTVDMAGYAKWLDEHGYDLKLNVGGGS